MISTESIPQMINIHFLGTRSGLCKEGLSHPPGKTDGGEYVVPVLKSKLKRAEVLHWWLSPGAPWK